MASLELEGREPEGLPEREQVPENIENQEGGENVEENNEVENDDIEGTEVSDVEVIEVVVTGNQMVDRLREIGAGITDCDTRWSAHLGTIGEQNKRAMQIARDTLLNTWHTGEHALVIPVEGTTVGEFIDTVKGALDDANMFASLIGTAWLAENKTSGDVIPKLEVERKKLVERWDSLVGSIAEFELMDVSTLPKIPPPPSLRKTSTAGAPVNKYGAQFYRIEGGVRTDVTGGSNQISQLAASYWGVSVGVLRDTLATNNGGTKVDESKPWHGVTTIGDKTVEWGWDIVPQTTATAKA